MWVQVPYINGNSHTCLPSHGNSRDRSQWGTVVIGAKKTSAALQ